MTEHESHIQTQEIIQHVQTSLNPYWLKVKETESDGNCFFQAIADQLTEHSIHESHTSLCKMAVDKIKTFSQVSCFIILQL